MSCAGKLADLDGTGPADLICLGARGCTLRYNQAGNGFAAAVVLDGFPPAHAVANVDVVDLEGRGTACLVWSSALEANRGDRVVDRVESHDQSSKQRPFGVPGLDQTKPRNSRSGAS